MNDELEAMWKEASWPIQLTIRLFAWGDRGKTTNNLSVEDLTIVSGKHYRLDEVPQW
jgi:hypothetical protein